MKAMLRNGMMSSEEVEANYFAAELIMPEEQVREMYDKLNGDIDDLASFFRVSKLAMAIRVDTLNLEK
jgi:Zn-dependent peptidase ImmA (M78 family)